MPRLAHSWFLWPLAVALAISWGAPANAADSAAEPEAQPVARTGTYAIENAALIPMSSEIILEDHTLVIENGRISVLCPSDPGCTPKHATVINGRGQHVIPALVDSHNHFGGYAFDGSDASRIRMRNQNLRQYVMFGVTTARDPSGNPQILETRDAINRGDLFGPVIYVATPMLDGNPPLFAGGPAFEEPEQAVNFVRHAAAQGYDLVKAYSTLSPDVFAAIMQTAREENLSVAAHVPIRVPLEQALQQGLRSIEHLTGYDVACAAPDITLQPNSRDIYQGWAWCTQEKINAMAELTSAYEVWNVPTLSLWDHTVIEFNRPGRGTEEARRWEHPTLPAGIDWLFTLYGPRERAGLTATRPVRLALVKALHDAGSPVLVGTDVSATGYTVHQEMQLFVEAGLSPYQALASATSEPARYLRQESEFGVLQPGARGDVLLLQANPLMDISNSRKIHGLMVHGQWWTRDMIEAELEDLQNEYAEDEQTIQRIKASSG